MTGLREFSDAHELRQHYRDLHARTRAWAPRPAPPPAPPPPALAAARAVQTWVPIHMTPMGRIMRAVADEFHMPLAMIRSRSRVGTVVVARHAAALLAKELTNMSTNKIGKMLGQYDHSTITFGIASVTHKIARDPALREKVERLRDKLLEKNEDDGDGVTP